jgi:predicted permease
LICFVGYILARRGILTANVRKSLNRLNVAVCAPTPAGAFI